MPSASTHASPSMHSSSVLLVLLCPLVVSTFTGAGVVVWSAHLWQHEM